MIKRTLIAVNLAVIFAASFATKAYADGDAKNTIFVRGDGMGPTTLTAAGIQIFPNGPCAKKCIRTSRVETGGE